MDNLAPGDLCEIVGHPTWFDPTILSTLGKVVILVDGPFNRPEHEYWSPYWRVSGLPPELGPREASYRVLRKIPPAPLNSDELIRELVDG
jgi:hypothetical protein